MVEARKVNQTKKVNTASKTTKAAAPSAAASQATPGASTTKGAATATKGGPKVVGAQRDDHECPVCLELCAQPVLTPCKHFMCFQCHKRVAEAGMTCPMCRAHFDKLYVPMVDRELQEQIAQQMGHLFEERKAELEEAGEWLGNKQLVRFAFGNTHEDVKNPQQARSNKAVKNSHRWCMFLSLNNSPEETKKYIKQVTYHLHPTFKPNKIVVNEAPFLLSRVGWGYFDIDMELEFQPAMGLPNKMLTHGLCFEDKGKTSSVFLEVSANDDGQVADKAVAKSLAAQLDKLKVSNGNEGD